MIHNWHDSRIRVGLMIATLSWGVQAAAVDPQTCDNSSVPETTPSSAFTEVGDGSIIRHDATGLEWRRCPLGLSWDGSACTGKGAADIYTWQEALEEAATRSGWRLPNINELRSLVEECRTTPAINMQAFPNTAPAYFWSASPVSGGRINLSAWYVYFRSGGDGVYRKSSKYQVRLVRIRQ